MTRTNWDNNHLQFARLLDEICAVGLSKKQLKELCTNMDLQLADIDELFDRAMLEWQRANRGHHPVRKYTPKKELKAYVSGPI